MAKAELSQVWMKPYGALVLVEWNACGCHPNDVMMRWGNGFLDAASYGTQSKSGWTRRLLARGWVRL